MNAKERMRMLMNQVEAELSGKKISEYAPDGKKKLMEAMGQGYVFVVSYGGAPVRASMQKDMADSYANEYTKVAASDPDGPKEVRVYRVDLI